MYSHSIQVRLTKITDLMKHLMLSEFRGRRRAIALVLPVFLTTGMLLQGNPITVTFQGTGSGNVTSTGSTTPVPFTNSPFTFSFTTDTTMISASGSVFNTPFVTGGTLSIGGMSGTFSIPVSAQVNAPFVNFELGLTSTSHTSLVGGSSTSFAQYNLQSGIGPLTLAALQVGASHPSVSTSFGSFVLTAVNSETFTATIATAPPGSVSITHFPVPHNTSPGGITTGPDGALWFTSGSPFGYGIGSITTAGVSTKFDLANGGGGPAMGIVTGSDGALWFTENNEGNKIGRITTTGHFTEYTISSEGVLPAGITSGPDGALWFTEQQDNKIGRITTAGVITQFVLPTSSGTVGITVGPDGALWFTEYNNAQIGRITTAGAITEYPLPRYDSAPEGITVGLDGALWFVESGINSIGRMTTAGNLKEYPLPAGYRLIGANGNDTLAITAGSDGALWFTDGNSQVDRMTTAGVVTGYFIPSTPENASPSAPEGITTGPDGAIWFTESANDQIGRITLPSPIIQAGGIVNNATNQTGIVAGSWLTIYGAALSGVTTNWNNASFANGLPTSLGGVTVSFNGQPAAVAYVSPTQLNVQAPSNISGNVSVVVTNNNNASPAVTATAVLHAPGLFAYTFDYKTYYPAALFLDDKIVGDPSVGGSGVRKATPGDIIQLYATGLGPSTGGVLITSPVTFADPLTVMIGSTPVSASYAGLVAPGEFQINFTVPNLQPGNYPLILQTDGASSQTSVILPVGD
jgi:virginiamycin B lyase